MVTKIQERQQGPLFENVVRFTEIRTRTEIGTSERIKWVDVVISRCPECKRIIGPGIPLKNQDEEP